MLSVICIEIMTAESLNSIVCRRFEQQREQAVVF